MKFDEDDQYIMPHIRNNAKKACVLIPEKHIKKRIEAAGLNRILSVFGPFYEELVKEFVVSVSVGCDDANSKDFRKVEVRENMVHFSTAVINNFPGRSVEPQAKFEVTNNQVCSEITSCQVRHWPNEGNSLLGNLL